MKTKVNWTFIEPNIIIGRCVFPKPIVKDGQTSVKIRVKGRYAYIEKENKK